MDFNFNFGGFGGSTNQQEPEPMADAEDVVEAKKSRRRTTECTALSKGYLYRRAYSEVSLLDSMQHQPLEDGHVYLFITAGDVDQLSFLKIVLNTHTLDYCLISSWVISAEDLKQIEEWIDDGRIKRLDVYVGEIFPKTYRIEFRMLQRLFEQHEGLGRYAIFRNHAKVISCYNEQDDFYYYCATSANCNTNPRIENATIVVDRGAVEWAKEYFDGINSFGDYE